MSPEAHSTLPDNILMPRPSNLDRSVSNSTGIRASDRFQVLSLPQTAWVLTGKVTGIGAFVRFGVGHMCHMTLLQMLHFRLAVQGAELLVSSQFVPSSWLTCPELHCLLVM